MFSHLSFKLFTLIALFTIGSNAESLLDALRNGGFTEFATLLGGPGGANILANSDNGLLVYAPTNAALLRLSSQGVGVQRRYDFINLDFDYHGVPRSGGDYKPGQPGRRSATCPSDMVGPGAVDLMTLLKDPAFVNLPAGQNASIVQKNMPKGALPVVHSGLGDVVKVVGLDIPYDNGIIRPVSGVFTLPQLLSKTLPFLGADKTLEVLDRTSLINDLDNRTGITFLAPDDRSIPSDLPDDVLADILRRHTIVGLPVFTSDLKHGDSYKTLAGTTVTVTVLCGDVFIGGARILAGDAIIKNGVVHTVDKLLEAPIIVTKTHVQTVTKTATETTQVKTTVATTETIQVGTTETVQVGTTETTTTTETVTPCLESASSVVTLPPTSEPESTPCTDSTKTTSSTSIDAPPPPPPPPTYTPSTSTSVPPPPPPPTYTPSTSTSVSLPPPPPTYTPSTSTSSYTPPPPPPSSTSTTTYAPPPSSEPESTPCTTNSTTLTSSSVYTFPPTSSTPPPPSNPPWTPSTYTPSTYSTEPTVSEPESTPYEASESTLSTPSTIWYYSSTTLVTSQRTTSIPVPTYDSVVTPPETSEPCTTSVPHGGYGRYGEHGEHGKGGDSKWDASHERGGGPSWY